jgi:hypothetical protein
MKKTNFKPQQVRLRLELPSQALATKSDPGLKVRPFFFLSTCAVRARQPPMHSSGTHVWEQARVIRFGEFSQIGRLFSLGS